MSAAPREASWPQGTLLAAQGMLPTMGVMLLVPVAPLLMREFGSVRGAAYLVPAILTVPALCIALFSVAAGYLGDRLGHRRVLLAALSVYGLAGMAPLVLGGLPQILISRTILGICEAAIITLSATLIGDYFSGAERSRWLGLTATFASFSAMAFAAISGLLADAWGWRGATSVYGIGLLFIPAMLLLTRAPTEHAPAERSEAQARFPLKHMALVGLTSLAGSILFYSLAVHQGLALASLGLERSSSIGFLSAAISFGTPLGSLLFIPMRKVRVSLLLCLSFFILGAALLIIAQAKGFIWFASGAFLGLIGAGLLLPTLISWAMSGLPPCVRGRGTGVFQSTFALGLFASGLIIPALANNVVDGILPAFGMLGLAGLAMAAFILVRGVVLGRRQSTLTAADGDCGEPLISR